ncbi:MAG: DUF3990 domain-containing protein [Bacteroidales bacterium]|nr:DUF3990 domain-containing protein [Bacteroidales bacterium]
MKLYHGTNTDFCEILLSRCRPNKDFGQGFYLTDIRSQAEAMAVRRCEFEESGVPIVQEYEFDETNLYMQHLITMETLVKELTYRQLNNQYFFGTERAIQQLRRV